MKDLENWLQVPEVTLHQAALLMADTDPTEFPTVKEDISLPRAYVPNIQFLSYGLLQGELSGKLVRHTFTSTRRNLELRDENDRPTDYTSIDRMKTCIIVSDIANYLSAKNKFCAFFNTDRTADNMLNPNYPKYAEKLAIAVKAWKAVSSNEDLTRIKSPKQAIKKWLDDNYADISAETRDSISTIANWDPKGGAPRSTPPKEKKVG